MARKKRAPGELRFRNARAKDKPYKLADRDALYLYVSTTGAKSWRFDFRHAGSRYTLTYGLSPDVSLEAARALHAKARSDLAAGQNPALLKRREKLAPALGGSFQAMGERWLEEKVSGLSKSWQSNAKRWLRYAYPHIGPLPVNGIKAGEMLAMLRIIKKKHTAHTAAYVRKVCALVFDYAIGNLAAEQNPAKLRSIIEAARLPKAKGHPHLALKEIPAFIRAIEASTANRETKLAARILLLTFTRKRELLHAERNEIDLEGLKWEIPGSRMKNGEPHLVPLSPQSAACFRELLEDLATGSRYVLQKRSDPDKPMSGMTLNALFARAGYGRKFTPHGVRATASTALNEAGFRSDVIERQLSHVERDAVRRAYNRADYLAERREMMDYWARVIDGLMAGGKIIPFKSARAA